MPQRKTEKHISSHSGAYFKAACPEKQGPSLCVQSYSWCKLQRLAVLPTCFLKIRIIARKMMSRIIDVYYILQETALCKYHTLHGAFCALLSDALKYYTQVVSVPAVFLCHFTRLFCYTIIFVPF